MLPVRFAVVGAIAAVCLWGLFSLLDNLNAPGLLRTEKAIVLKGCDSPRGADRQLCTWLRCQKSLLEQHRVPLRARFETEQVRAPWIAGRAVDARHQTTLGYFACEVSADTASTAQWLGAAGLEAFR